MVAATTLILKFIRNPNWPSESRVPALIWCLFLVAIMSCVFLVTLNRPGIGLHGWRLPNTVGVIALFVLIPWVTRGLHRQILTNMPVQIRPR
jgi:hypothetical protein